MSKKNRKKQNYLSKLISGERENAAVEKIKQQLVIEEAKVRQGRVQLQGLGQQIQKLEHYTIGKVHSCATLRGLLKELTTEKPPEPPKKK